MNDGTEDAGAGPDDRGELMLELGGEQLGLRPSFEAITAIEQTLGRGLVDVTRDALNAKLTLGEASQVACECIRAWGREHEHKGATGANASRIAKLILDSTGGLHARLRDLSGMLSLAVTGGYDSSGNLKPATTKTTSTTEAPVAG